MNAREAAVNSVLAVTDKKKSIHKVVAEMLREMEKEGARERSLAKRLTEGTIERLLCIDYVINSFSKTKTDKMKPVIRGVLRVGVYQLLFMDNIPASAACNEAVKYVKAHGLTGLSGFVNGVLRTVSREGAAVLSKINSADESKLSNLEIKYSVPVWLLEQWTRDYGAENCLKIAGAQFDVQPLYLRVNTSKAAKEECLERLMNAGFSCKFPTLRLPAEASSFELNVIEVENAEGLFEQDIFKQGFVTVQDISSILVGEAAGLKGGEQVLDLCAAPGGKTMHFADKLATLEKGGRVSSRDVSESKIKLINENLVRCGFDNVDLSVADASVADKGSIGRYDLVLADVPCSGTGVTGRKPDIKYNMNEKTQQELIELQGKILENATEYLKPGGTLIFSTCTLNRAENVAGMKLLEGKGLTKELEIQLIPGVHSGDGFFISKYKKA